MSDRDRFLPLVRASLSDVLRTSRPCNIQTDVKAIIPHAKALKARDFVWLLALMFGIWFALTYDGLDRDLAFLIGMSGAIIAGVACIYWAARSDIRYWAVISAYVLLHVLFFAFIGGKWMPHPAGLITPLFMLDFLVMAVLFPRLSRVSFVDG